MVAAISRTATVLESVSADYTTSKCVLTAIGFVMAGLEVWNSVLDLRRGVSWVVPLDHSVASVMPMLRTMEHCLLHMVLKGTKAVNQI